VNSIAGQENRFVDGARLSIAGPGGTMESAKVQTMHNNNIHPVFDEIEVGKRTRQSLHRQDRTHGNFAS